MNQVISLQLEEACKTQMELSLANKGDFTTNDLKELNQNLEQIIQANKVPRGKNNVNTSSVAKPQQLNVPIGIQQQQ